MVPTEENTVYSKTPVSVDVPSIVTVFVVSLNIAITPFGKPSTYPLTAFAETSNSIVSMGSASQIVWNIVDGVAGVISDLNTVTVAFIGSSNKGVSQFAVTPSSTPVSTILNIPGTFVEIGKTALSLVPILVTVLTLPPIV